MNTKAQSVKNLVVVLGMLMAALLMHIELSAQTATPQEYKCTPCGCSQDSVIVHEPGNCSHCGMKLVNIHNPSEGLPYTNLFNYQACNLISSTQGLLILDVRSEGEFAQRTSRIGKFKNAINIPITEIEKRIGELEKYKELPILVYCSVSARSPRVSQLLAENGFSKIYNLMGGLSAWNAANPKDLPCQNSYVVKD